MRSAAPFAFILKSAAVLAATLMSCGCASVPLDDARGNFYSGRFARADEQLTNMPENNKDRVLLLMERGMIRQQLEKYEESASDWRSSAELSDLLETYSVSRGTASLISNDRVLSFRGKPFERTLLFAFLALDYLALENWDYAAICARNIIQHLEHLDGYPDIAYAHYTAGFCLQLIGDYGNAALQYRTASQLLPDIEINDATGAILPHENTNAAPAAAPFDFVCFAAMGRAYSQSSANATPESAVSADFYQNGSRLGQSVEFNSVDYLSEKTAEQTAIREAAKEISRIALKETISEALEQQNELLGFLARATLYAMEIPDTRRWETLPMRLHIARLPCSEPVTNYTVVFKNASGAAVLTNTISTPITRSGNVFISFCRDIQASQKKTETAPAAITPSE
jgi:tetratricopeptide (TPR) repeat protein